ncbi:MAG TPA: sugar phosphate nucleotidyltransferase [Gaiellaceae bacterium]|nr:sugar phosphate nucleotidyltransferase [Gaiellaceae bacterium]
MLSAVVMAAGIGTRLRPLTELFAKPLLPIDGRPVLAQLLLELADAGCRDVTVVVGHLAGQVQRFAGDGGAFGLSIRYAGQAEPNGSADAVVSARAQAPYLVLGADTVFAAGDVGRFAAAFRADEGAAGAIAVRARRPEDGPAGVRLRAGSVERLLAGSRDVVAAPLWAAGPGLAERIESLPGRAPFELATAFQQAIDAGERVAGIEIGPTRDLTTPEDLLVENFPYLKALRT